MKIAVCVKQIPDPADPGALDPNTKTLKRDGKLILDESDSYGVEMALQRRFAQSLQVDRNQRLRLHAKVTVADDTVLIGSFNLSHSGETNAENVLEIEDPAQRVREALIVALALVHLGQGALVLVGEHLHELSAVRHRQFAVEDARMRIAHDIL